MPRNPLKVLDILPRIVILLIWAICTSVYMWDLSTFIKKGEELLRDWLFVGIFIFISIIWVWSYIVACWSDPGSTEKYYKKLGVLDDINSKKIPPELTLMPVCNKCHLPKPERAHHCSKCNQCYFRWDHHCPWIGNCVAMKNFKGFLLMPAYGGVLLILFAIELGVCHKNALCIIPLPFAIYFIYFSSSYFSKMKGNYTSIEKAMLKQMSPYYVGILENLSQFFSGFFGIVLPTPPTISGFHWCGEQVEGMVYELEDKMGYKHHKRSQEEVEENSDDIKDINENDNPDASIPQKNISKDAPTLDDNNSKDAPTLDDNADDSNISSSDSAMI